MEAGIADVPMVTRCELTLHRLSHKFQNGNSRVVQSKRMQSESVASRVVGIGNKYKYIKTAYQTKYIRRSKSNLAMAEHPDEQESQLMSIEDPR